MEPTEENVEQQTGPAHGFNFNTVFGVLFVVASAVLFLIIPGQIEKPLFVLDENVNALKPNLFPRLAAIGFGGLGVWLFFRSFSIDEKNKFKNLDRQAIANVLVTLVMMSVYGPLMMQIGFVVSSAVVIAALSTFFGNRSYGLTAAISIVIPVSIFFVFTNLLATSLPPFPIDTPLTRLYLL
ncbi:MAG: tripartite tricarboxylate transporter TctB family protein [Proteobacteria bacterium]|nr:tripartite tricarboxylate transporter TctB family protein [Pseudomonadota bacterium]